MQEFSTTRERYPIFKNQYVPVYSVNPNKGPVFVRENIYSFNSKECPTCISSSESGNVVIIGDSDDSLVIRDVRSQYSEKI